MSEAVSTDFYPPSATGSLEVDADGFPVFGKKSAQEILMLEDKKALGEDDDDDEKALEDKKTLGEDNSAIIDGKPRRRRLQILAQRKGDASTRSRAPSTCKAAAKKSKNDEKGISRQYCLGGCVDVWMDMWMDGWMDGWMDQ